MVPILINGLVSGGMYAVLSVGFSLVFGVAKILNMAHTTFYMITAFFMFFLITKLAMQLPLAAILVIIAVSFLGILCFKLLLDRVKVHLTAVMIISMALALLFQEIFLLIYGEQYRNIPPFMPGFIEIFEVKVLLQHLFALGASLLTLIGIWILLSRTRLGKAIRAVEQDSEIANLAGIDVSKISMIVMGMSTGIAAIAGIVVAPIVMLHPLMWEHPLVIVLCSVVLGGLGSIKGSVIGAFILGFAETAVIFILPGGSYLKGAVSMAVMVAVLMIRPEGLFGIVFEEERL
jgi:branched-chain amino acid transport system permease protein